MTTFHELKNAARLYHNGRSSEVGFRQTLEEFARDYSTHAELDRLAAALAETTGN